MQLNERMYQFSGTLKEFISTITQMKNSSDIKERQCASKYFYKIQNTNYCIPASTYFHDYKKHKMKLYDWLELAEHINEPIFIVEAEKSKSFTGVNYLSKYYFEQEYFGVGFCDTHDGIMITTYFRDAENRINDWINDNKKRTPLEVPSTSKGYGSPFDEGFTNIIQKSQENVNPYKTKIFYHGSNYKFDKFDKSKIKENKLGLCFNFTDDYSIAYQYGDNILKVHLDLNNPITEDDLDRVLTYKEDCLLCDIMGFPKISKERFEQEKGRYSETIGSLYKVFKMKPKFIQFLQKLGYDGVSFPEDHHYGVFEPEQIHIIKNEFENLNEKLQKILEDDYMVYHGTNQTFNVFDLSKVGENTRSKGFFNFTDSKEVAKTYGDNILKCIISMDSPITIDCEGSSTIKFLGKYYTPSKFAQLIDEINKDLENHYIIEEEIIEELKLLGFSPLYADIIDGIILKNCKDSFNLFDDLTSTNYIVFKPEQIKKVG